jgi:hypothetical protein
MNVIDWLRAQADKVPAKFRGGIYGLLFVGAVAALVYPDQFQAAIDQVNLASDKVGKVVAAVAGILALLKLNPDDPKPDGDVDDVVEDDTDGDAVEDDTELVAVDDAVAIATQVKQDVVIAESEAITEEVPAPTVLGIDRYGNTVTSEG